MSLVVEAFAGVIGVTFAALGRPALTPRQGCKTRYAAAPIAALGLDKDPPTAVVANDLSPWGVTWDVLADPTSREAVARRLEAEVPSKARYLELHKAPVPTDPVAFAHEHLVLERWAFSGRPVSIKDGRWKAMGYGRNEAEGRKADEKFGAIAPQIPTLVSRLRDFPALMIEASQDDALTLDPFEFPRESRVVLDPPYPGTADYGHDVESWAAFVEYAIRWGERCATVVTCRDPVPELVAAGWAEMVPNRKGKKGTMGARTGESGVERDGELLYVSPTANAEAARAHARPRSVE